MRILSQVIKTKWTLACEQQGNQSQLVVLEDHYITIEDGLIKQISSAAPASEECLIDYKNALALPGLINLHCHLDYSNLACDDLLSGSGNKDSINLFDWIPSLISKTASWSQDQYFTSSLRGARLAAESGTSFLVDNSFLATSGINALTGVGIKGLVGLELFGIDPSEASNQFAKWLERFEKAEQGLLKASSTVQLTVSPHAPYTVSPMLWRLAADFASKRHTKVLAHISESRAEYDWFKNKTIDTDNHIDRFLIQAFTRFRNQDGLEEQVSKMIQGLAWRACGLSPIEHLNQNELLDSNLLATHCAKVADQDIDLIRRKSTSVALCPVSNYLLCNPKAPVEKFVSNQIKTGLGTDSLASSYSLDLRQVARFILENQNEVDDDNQLNSEKMILLLTIEAAKALGKEESIGSIEAGKCADILILQPIEQMSPNISKSKIFELALSKDTLVKDLFVDGRKVVSNAKAVHFHET